MPPVPDSLSKADRALVEDLLAQKPAAFTDLTQTQYEAFDQGVLDEGNHLLLAETGNGKTFVAEAVIKKALQQNERVAYLVPSRALVGEKHDTIASWAPESATITKGRGYTQADVGVATFESYYEAVIRGYAHRFDVVVLDDFHEIYSSHRGPNIEKAISAALEANQELLGISATIGNPDAIARWLDADLTISTERRAVPIDERPVEKTDEHYGTQIARIIRDNRERGPFLVFNYATAHTKSRAERIATELSLETGADVDFRAAVEAAVSTELTDAHRELIDLLRNGVAYHHAQMETGLKDLIESYAEDGIVECVCCTTTLSYGFDSPVQSVIVADLRRQFEYIGVYEYVQWIGRAGRDASAYDQAYAFPMVQAGDDEAAEQFQFDTPVEEKTLEPVTTHLGDQAPLRWLVLELVAHGWETTADVLEFVRSTLAWSTAATQRPGHQPTLGGETPADEIVTEVLTTLEWLTDRGLLNRPVGQPQGDHDRYTPTPLGEALVEYEHDNWFDNTIEDVLALTEWLADQDADLTPEQLVAKLAETYYHCDLMEVIEGEGTISTAMAAHDLSGSEGTTAAVVCWLWCAGMSITEIERRLGSDDLSGLASTAANISTAVGSIRLLYEPQEMPREPPWLERFATQVDVGVPGPDMYLVDTVDHFGRRRYDALRNRLSGFGAESAWYPGDDSFLIERLSALYAETDVEQFEAMVKDVRGIGSTIYENIREATRAWDPDTASTATVPFTESARERDESGSLQVFHDPATRDGDEPDDEFSTGTTLADFE
jgi:replicative superfamily II helicase